VASPLVPSHYSHFAIFTTSGNVRRARNDRRSGSIALDASIRRPTPAAAVWPLSVQAIVESNPFALSPDW